MQRTKRLALVLCLLALGESAAGKGGDKPDLSFHFRDETAPAGGTVQMKMERTVATPISGGRPRFAFDRGLFQGVAGIGIFAPTGEAAGAAVLDGDQVAIAYVTTTPLTSGEYPVMTVALRIREDAAPGSQGSFTLDPASRWSLNGASAAAKVSPGLVTVGGSVAISDVIPGEGWFPAGTVVSVRGVGFQSRSRLRLEDAAITAVRVVSSTEIQFTLREAATMTAARVRVDNPDGSRSIYYSYMRGIPAATSGRTLLSTTEPIFSGATRSEATVGPIPAMSGAQYFALALQNPNLTPADVAVWLLAADGAPLWSAARSLENGHRLMLELSELLDGVEPPAGSWVRVTSSLPIEAFGLACDEGTWTVTPRLPAEATSSTGP